MVKTTIYLSEHLKARLAHAAARRQQPEAVFIRDAIERALLAEPPTRQPALGWLETDDPTLADRFDEILAEGFGAP